MGDCRDHGIARSSAWPATQVVKDAAWTPGLLARGVVGLISGNRLCAREMSLGRSAAIFAASVITAYATAANPNRNRFDEIDVQRINVMSPVGSRFANREP